jgi:tetratricopeptide (TPR) repeat protein
MMANVELSKMKINARATVHLFLPFLSLLSIALMMSGCGAKSQASFTTTNNAIDPCALALAPHKGNEEADREIFSWQQEARAAKDSSRALERLGWAYVAKARAAYDTGYYKLAEQCALCIEAKQQGRSSPESLLLRGHALQSQHRFREAETMARELVRQRGIPFDYGLLGDVLLDVGKLDEAIVAYQKMVDMRPDLQSYTRAAQARWMKGNLTGAIELMRVATASASPQDSESAAYSYTRLALYELQAGQTKQAKESCMAALEFRKDYAPALLMRGKILLVQNKANEAIDSLKRAADLNPLPEYQWTLAEGLRAAGKEAEAKTVEVGIVERGATEDPRTYALFLATRKEQTETALSLAREELKARDDVFTQDTLAWALFTAGKMQEANEQMKKALSAGTKDARLFYHAGAIAAALGQKREARKWLQQAQSFQQTLLPSERVQLVQELAAL